MPLQATSGAASYDGFGGGVPYTPTYIEDVFSTWLYTGTGSTQTITNGIDLSGKGGLVWFKNRGAATNNLLLDTARGANQLLISNNSNGQTSYTGLNSFNNNGFTLNVDPGSAINASGNTYASWTFRKQPKFFDVVTYTGNNTNNRQISHNLGSVPGCIIVKCTSSNGAWWVYHRSIGFSDSLFLNSTSGLSGTGIISATSSTTFTIPSATDGINDFGASYVAYLFAHNAGGFGLTGTDNVISCGSFTTNGSGFVPDVNLGYEPQWILLKQTNSANAWFMFDNMRGWSQTNSQYLYADSSMAEASWNGAAAQYLGVITPTGFKGLVPSGANNGTFIYIAIRRGPMRTPTSGTSVFLPKAYTGTGFSLNKLTGASFSPDTFWPIPRPGGVATARYDKLRGTRVFLFGAPSGAAALEEQTDTSGGDGLGYQVESFNNDGVSVNRSNSQTNQLNIAYIGYMFGRAPGFFDVVCYTGSPVSVNHNLGVTPEMIIAKSRANGTGPDNWAVATSNVNYLSLNLSNASLGGGVTLSATSTTFDSTTVRTADNYFAGFGGVTAVAYLFASCPGVSKVGSYTGNGSSRTINCGFTGGARFVLIKRTDDVGDWVVFDSARGIVAGNDPFLELNTDAAEQTGQDAVDADSTGFIVNQTTENLNVNGASYIFLAIA